MKFEPRINTDQKTGMNILAMTRLFKELTLCKKTNHPIRDHLCSFAGGIESFQSGYLRFDPVSNPTGFLATGGTLPTCA